MKRLKSGKEKLLKFNSQSEGKAFPLMVYLKWMVIFILSSSVKFSGIFSGLFVKSMKIFRIGRPFKMATLSERTAPTAKSEKELSSFVFKIFIFQMLKN